MTQEERRLELMTWIAQKALIYRGEGRYLAPTGETVMKAEVKRLCDNA